MSNEFNTVLYIGVTSDLKARIWEHINKVDPNSFTARYGCNKLVWYDIYPQITDAIFREKQLKAGNRKNKEKLINDMNPTWKNLWEAVGGW